MVIGQVAAQANQTPPEMAQFLQPLVDVISPFVSVASWLLGGVFGIYLILLVVRIYYEHRKLKILIQIRDGLVPKKKNNGKKK